MRIPLIVVSAMALLFPACGGGDGAGTPSLQLTRTTGNVTSLLGESSDVLGVRVQVPVTGGDATTGTDGRFDLGDLPSALVQMVISAPGAATSDVDVDLTRGGAAVLRLTIDQDGVTRMSVEHCDGDDSANETSAPLTAIEAGLKGKVEVESDHDGDMEFEVEVEHLAAGRTVEIFVTNALAQEESQGQVAADAEGEAELEIEDGARLPFGVSDVADLEGFVVTVRDATSNADLMVGTVPALGAVPEPCQDQDDHDGEDGDELEGKSRLTNATGVLGEAEVELESEPGEEEFEVEVEMTNIVGTIEVWLEDPNAPGAFGKLGDLAQGDDPDELEFELETEDGDALPFGVSGVGELTGLQIELRAAADGAVLYFGTIPPLNPS